MEKRAKPHIGPNSSKTVKIQFSSTSDHKAPKKPHKTLKKDEILEYTQKTNIQQSLRASSPDYTKTGRNSSSVSSSTSRKPLKISERDLQSLRAKQRAARWAAQDLSQNPELIKALREGVFKHRTVHNHKYRDVEKSKHMSHLPMISKKYNKLVMN